MIAKLPIEKIEKINIYVNTFKKTLSEIKAETKADYIINGSLYDFGTFKANGTLVVDRQEISYQQGVYGFRFDSGKPTYAYYDNVYHKGRCEHFITTKPMLVVNGIATNDTGGLDTSNRGRSAIGITDNELVLVCTDDVIGTSDYTFSELTNELLNAGCIAAGNLDGGGSSQCDFAGEKITSTRIVANYILVYLKEESKEETEQEKGEITMKKICFDVGHDPTTVNGNAKYNYNEWVAMREIGDIINERKSDFPDLDIYVVDNPSLSGADELNWTVSEVNRINPELCISMHSNAFSNPDAKGTVCICYSKTSGGYRLSELINKYTAEVFPDISIRDIWIVPNSYAIVRETNCPAVIFEMGFHTNDLDIQYLLNHKNSFAEIMLMAVCEYTGTTYTPPKVDVEPEEETTISDYEKEKEEVNKWALENKISSLERLEEATTRQETLVMLKRMFDIIEK